VRFARLELAASKRAFCDLILFFRMTFHHLGKLFVAFTGLVKARRNTKDMETPDLVYAAGLG